MVNLNSIGCLQSKRDYQHKTIYSLTNKKLLYDMIIYDIQLKETINTVLTRIYKRKEIVTNITKSGMRYCHTHVPLTIKYL